ncbi:MAG TPA: VCBS repeat-containing protein [Pseudomonadota bacterium]|nr:VCBS repeat-containing protein [Pseudomonadota bacterium]
MSSLSRFWFCLSVLLFTLSCETQRTVTLGIGHIPKETAELQILMALQTEGSGSVLVSNERVRVDFQKYKDSPNLFDLFRIGAKLPNELRGRLIVGVGAVQKDGTLLGAGDGRLDFPTDGELAIGVDIERSQETEGMLLGGTVSDCVRGPLMIDQVEQVTSLTVSKAQTRLRLHGFGFLPRAKASVLSASVTVEWRSFSKLDVLTDLPQSPSGVLTTEILVEEPDDIRCLISTRARTVTFVGVLTDPAATQQDQRNYRILGMPLSFDDEVKDVTSGDVDGDGFPDLFLSGSRAQGTKGFLAVLHNRGTLEGGRLFDDPETYEFSGGSGESVVTGDWNSDGKVDAAVSSKSQNKVAVFYQESAVKGQRFRIQMAPGGERPDFILKGDVNEDNKVDLITGPTNDINGKAMYLIYNLGSAFSMDLPAYYDGVANFMSDLLYEDMNADGKRDFSLVYFRIVTVGSERQTIGAVQTFMIQPDKSLVGTGEHKIHGIGGRAVIGDLDGNGTKDIVAAGPYLPDAQAASNQLSILFNDGSGKYQQPHKAVDTISQPFSLALGDFNLDGKLDVAVANANATENGRIAIHLNLGNGNLISQAFPDFFTDAGYSADLEVTDVNRDGKSDLIVLSSAFPGNGKVSRIQVLLNTTNR